MIYHTTHSYACINHFLTVLCLSLDVAREMNLFIGYSCYEIETFHRSLITKKVIKRKIRYFINSNMFVSLLFLLQHILPLSVQLLVNPTIYFDAPYKIFGAEPKMCSDVKFLQLLHSHEFLN